MTPHSRRSSAHGTGRLVRSRFASPHFRRGVTVASRHWEHENDASPSELPRHWSRPGPHESEESRNGQGWMERCLSLSIHCFPHQCSLPIATTADTNWLQAPTAGSMYGLHGTRRCEDTIKRLSMHGCLQMRSVVVLDAIRRASSRMTQMKRHPAHRSGAGLAFSGRAL